MGEPFSVEKEQSGVVFNNTAATIVNGFLCLQNNAWLAALGLS